MIKEIEIKDHGVFTVKDDMTHRSRVYLKINRKDRFKQVQFDSLKIDSNEFQLGYDYNGHEIYIKIITRS